MAAPTILSYFLFYLDVKRNKKTNIYEILCLNKTVPKTVLIALYHKTDTLERNATSR